MFKGIFKILISYALILYSLLLLISLVKFSPNDLNFYTTNLNTVYSNILGFFGVALTTPIVYAYGNGAWVFAVSALIFGFKILSGITPQELLIRVGIVHYLSLLIGILSVMTTNNFSFIEGGIFGSLIGNVLVKVLPNYIWIPVLSVLFIWGLSVISRIPDIIQQKFYHLFQSIKKPSYQPAFELAGTDREEVYIEQDENIDDAQIYQESISENSDTKPYTNALLPGSEDINEFYDFLEDESYPYKNQVPSFLQEIEENENTPTFLSKKSHNVFSNKNDILRDVEVDFLAPYFSGSNSFYDKMESNQIVKSRVFNVDSVSSVKDELLYSAEGLDELDQSSQLMVPSSDWVKEGRISMSDFVIKSPSVKRLSFDQGFLTIDNVSDVNTVNIDKSANSSSKNKDVHMESTVESTEISENTLNDTVTELQEPQHISNFPPVSNLSYQGSVILEEIDEDHANTFSVQKDVEDQMYSNVSDALNSITETEKILIQGVERTLAKQKEDAALLKEKIHRKQQELAKKYYEKLDSKQDQGYVEEIESSLFENNFSLHDFENEIMELKNDIHDLDTVSQALADDAFFKNSSSIIDSPILTEQRDLDINSSEEEHSSEELLKEMMISEDSIMNREIQPIETSIKEEVSDMSPIEETSDIIDEIASVDISALENDLKTTDFISDHRIESYRDDEPQEPIIPSLMRLDLNDNESVNLASISDNNQMLSEIIPQVLDNKEDKNSVVNQHNIDVITSDDSLWEEDPLDGFFLENSLDDNSIDWVNDQETTYRSKYNPEEELEFVIDCSEDENDNSSEEMVNFDQLSSNKDYTAIATDSTDIDNTDTIEEFVTVEDEDNEWSNLDDLLSAIDVNNDEDIEQIQPTETSDGNNNFNDNSVLEEYNENIFVDELDDLSILEERTENSNPIDVESTDLLDLDAPESLLMPSVTTQSHLVQPLDYPVSDIENSMEDEGNDINFMSEKKDYMFPRVEDLDPNMDSVAKEDEDEEIENTMKMIEDTYESFNINMQVVDYNRGPTITRFELEPPSGLKLRTILNLQDDLALQAGTSNIRIISPVEGRSLIGIEVPNKVRRNFLLREQIESDLFEHTEAALPLILGVDVAGKEIVGDLATTPHLLIAGTTGSGKSVYVNALIMGLLYKLSPEDLKFIMIDPKMVELELYNGIPHLLAPIITKPEEAMAALEWAVQEMDRRYKILSELSVRNIKEYQKLIEDTPTKEQGYEKLPYIVIIVDEFANLMLRAPKDTEKHISRLASMSRAVGIHLVLATQRPSVDVVTGVIKANFPSRIAFRVSSKIDSRTIIDRNGAETLLGRGDMLFMSPNYMEPVRIQSPYASSEDVARAVNTIKKNGPPDYAIDFSEVLARQESDANTSESSLTDALNDPLFEEVLRYAVDNGEISASGIQRRFRVGYNRASRLIESMKDIKIISPPPSAGKGWLINITRDEIDKYLE